MIMRREIGAKGQVVIPKDIREYLGLKRGEKVIFEIRNKEVLIKQEQDPQEFLQDFLNIPKLKRDKRKIKDMILEQYEEDLS
ncbi:MAG: AbrB/MazE/SpoVT family DNA-binding domain-containing protein [Nanoarchaeota archaeon]|nr:AbrB/MazE/SpoVT family DNA-binding domain-containing protein [Nanoarchaeota archaeon]